MTNSLYTAVLTQNNEAVLLITILVIVEVLNTANVVGISSIVHTKLHMSSVVKV